MPPNPHPEKKEDPAAVFLRRFAESLEAATLVKLVLARYRGPNAGLQRLIVRPVKIKGAAHLNFTYRHRTKDVVANRAPPEALEHVRTLLGNEFLSAHLLTANHDVQLDFSRKGKPLLSETRVAARDLPSAAHDSARKEFIDPHLPFLHSLGVTDADGKVLPSMSRKWRQINKFVEILSQAIDSSALKDRSPIRLVDFGSGKGYLTFSAHAYLHHERNIDAMVTGVEQRQDLVAACTGIVSALGILDLSFTRGDISDFPESPMDVMVALHACDTATDLALARAIKSGASVILSVPCCHKEIRPQMRPPPVLEPLLRFGIHREREAEMVTDSLRALFLEAAGYKVQISEFTSLEHTQRNSLIMAVKLPAPVDPAPILRQIQALKDFYGISEFKLETQSTIFPRPVRQPDS